MAHALACRGELQFAAQMLNFAEFLQHRGSWEKKSLLGAQDKDRVQIQRGDAAGLITAEVEDALPVELQARQQHIRETE